MHHFCQIHSSHLVFCPFFKYCFSFLSCPATTSPFILPSVQTESFISTKDAFLPSVSACPLLLITAPLVSIAIRQQKHSALKTRQILVAASPFIFFFLFSLQQLPPAFTSAEIWECADVHPTEWTKEEETAAYGSVSKSNKLD